MFLNQVPPIDIPYMRLFSPIAFLILVAGISTSAFAVPIEIGTVVDLQKIGNDPAYSLDGNYVLARDIDASATATWNGGAGFVPIGNMANPFTGTFDGHGYVISDLTINDSGDAVVGLFGVAGEQGGQGTGYVENVVLQRGAISGPKNGSYVGGLAGLLYGTLTNCCTMSTVSGTRSVVGGVAGMNAGTITNCYATGTTSGAAAGSNVGGLVGSNLGTLTNCYATGAVSGQDVGGLIGLNHVTLTGCYATGTTSGSGNVGGLVGYNGNDNASGGPITNCYATGTVSGTGSGDVGGLVGGESGTIMNCHATGTVSCTGSGNVGGLVGSGGRIMDSYATGTVSGAGSGNVGGLVGDSGIILNSCATGAVSCTGSGDVGGLVGRNDGAIKDCYSSGAVSGSGLGAIGGLVGNNEYQVVGCYWDMNTSGRTASAGGTGETTALMMERTTFVGWNFESRWSCADGNTYPCLRPSPPDEGESESEGESQAGDGYLVVTSGNVFVDSAACWSVHYECDGFEKCWTLWNFFGLKEPLAPGTYKVIFQDVAATSNGCFGSTGYTTPPDQQVTITAGQTTYITAKYVPDTGKFYAQRVARRNGYGDMLVLGGFAAVAAGSGQLKKRKSRRPALKAGELD
jgi:hypothetical protein